MRHHVFAAAMLSTTPLAYAADDITLQTIKVRTDKPATIDSVVVVSIEGAPKSYMEGMKYMLDVPCALSLSILILPILNRFHSVRPNVIPSLRSRDAQEVSSSTGRRRLQDPQGEGASQRLLPGPRSTLPVTQITLGFLFHHLC